MTNHAEKRFGIAQSVELERHAVRDAAKRRGPTHDGVDVEQVGVRGPAGRQEQHLRLPAAGALAGAEGYVPLEVTSRAADGSASIRRA